MRGPLRNVLLILVLSLIPRPAAASEFAISLPADSAVEINSPSRLEFTVTNTGAEEGLSRLTLRFPSGYRVAGGSAPRQWTVELGPGGSGSASDEISFRTRKEANCKGAIAPGGSLVFEVEVIAPASRAVSPDSLVNAEGEQSCEGVAFDAPAMLPSWDRLGVEVDLAAGPLILGLGGDVTVTLTLTNLSTVELTDVWVLLRPTGTGSVGGLVGPTPPNLTLAPGASGRMSWAARAASAGTVSFSGQAVSRSVTSPPVQSDTLFVGDLEVSLSVTPEQVVSGQDVEVEMTVTNRGPLSVANVIPSSLTFEGTATASAAAGPSPASLPLLEPGESAAFAWAATITGEVGETYAFSGWASAEWEAIFSLNVISNRGVLSEQVASEPESVRRSITVGRGVSGSGSGQAGASTPSTGGSSAPAVPSATLQLIGVNHDGTETGGAQFSGGLVRNLRILVGWNNLSGSHTQRLELFSPDGSLYQRLSAQFTGTSVETRLSVGGTWITQHSLFGAWGVKVYLDRERMPITSGVFVLTP
ncbi:MAG: hypothetical protein ACE5KX_03455 [Acidimicrobiia bacterium]